LTRKLSVSLCVSKSEEEPLLRYIKRGKKTVVYKPEGIPIN
jgi:hypothetical protein